MTLTGTLPSFNRTLSSYLKEDGTYKYISGNSISEQLALSVTQEYPADWRCVVLTITGGAGGPVGWRQDDGVYERAV